tara:strand:+ start:2552 stop:3274 length:723 start_codon:yes stop_codon:yes gene_type:complete
MKIKIGPHVDWIGPYQLAEKLCFWAKDVEDEHGFKHKPDWVHNFGEWLAHGSVEPDAKIGDITSWNSDRHDTLLSRFLSWIHSKQQRTIKVHIDRWDTWSMDHTLAFIVLPMLKQLNATKHGAPQVDDTDVPKELHMTKKEKAAFDKDGSTDNKFFKRWDWVMGEMIFAFESKVGDGGWEEQFESGESDIQWKRLENGNSEMIRGPNDTKVYDWEGRKAYQARISNGFRLFGKYFESLWD